MLSLEGANPQSAIRSPQSFKWYGIDRRVRSDFLRPFGDDSFIRLQSVFDHPHRSDAGADLDGSNVYFVVGAHDGDPVTALQFGDRALWDEQRALFHAGYRADPGVLPRSKSVARIRKGSGQPYRASLLIDLPVGDEKLPFLWKGRAVGQYQLKL